MQKNESWLLLVLACTTAMQAAASDLIPVKQISLELASTIAMKSVEACRKDGYNVSAVVLDRVGSLQVALRDSLAAPSLTTCAA